MESKSIDFPGEMRKARRALCLSAKQMGGMLGISGEQVTRMERGLELIPHEVFQKLEEVTGRAWGEEEYQPVSVKLAEWQLEKNRALYEEMAENYAPEKVREALEMGMQFLEYSLNK